MIVKIARLVVNLLLHKSKREIELEHKKSCRVKKIKLKRKTLRISWETISEGLCVSYLNNFYLLHGVLGFWGFGVKGPDV
jgi:hypothetical protein